MIELVQMDSGVKSMLKNNKYNELKDLYELFNIIHKNAIKIFFS